MCELLGITAKKAFYANNLLERFFSHSEIHRDGWGIAFIDGGTSLIEKETVTAYQSSRLRELLDGEILTRRAIAHIRKATIGDIEYNNTHPFSASDITGRVWTLAHNGTIFEGDELTSYQYKQIGRTDSERILLYIVDQINDHIESGFDLSDIKIRSKLIEQLIVKLAPGNKLNLLISDGEYLYVHKNDEGTLFAKISEGQVVFATKPLDDTGWSEVPGNRLFVYHDGDPVFTGTPHGFTYIHDEDKTKTLYMEYAAL